MSCLISDFKLVGLWMWLSLVETVFIKGTVKSAIFEDGMCYFIEQCFPVALYG